MDAKIANTGLSTPNGAQMTFQICLEPANYSLRAFEEDYVVQIQDHITSMPFLQDLESSCDKGNRHRPQRPSANLCSNGHADQY